MQTGTWRFRPKLWPTLVTLALLPVLISLGFWQMDRAARKETLQKVYETRKNANPVNLTDLDKNILLNTNEMVWRRLLVRGTYLPDKQFLLDNQIMRGQAGYLVYTPFRLEDRNLLVIINRGWVPAGPDRTRTPRLTTPANRVELQGVAKLPQSPGIVLEQAQNEPMENGFVRLQHLDLERLGETFESPLLPYIIRLEGENNEGLLREWRQPGFGKEKHLGYAFQWFALSAALVIIYIVVNLKRIRSE